MSILAPLCSLLPLLLSLVTLQMDKLNLLSALAAILPGDSGGGAAVVVDCRVTRTMYPILCYPRDGASHPLAVSEWIQIQKLIVA